jgi:hypothetical protein
MLTVLESLLLWSFSVTGDVEVAEYTPHTGTDTTDVVALLVAEPISVVPSVKDKAP